MASDVNFDAGRFERFASDVLAPATFSGACPLEVAAFQCEEPVSYEDAARGTYQPVTIGWEWGPVWSTAWFRVSGSVPRALAGRCVVLRFSTGTEALLWRGGPSPQPWHGLDLNRDAVVLFADAVEGERVDLMIEAACNHHLGQLGTHWDAAEFLARWQSAHPAKLARCELAAYDETAWRLHRSYVFAVQLMRELPREGARAQDLAGALRRATNLIDERRFSQTAPGGAARDPGGADAPRRRFGPHLPRRRARPHRHGVAVAHPRDEAQVPADVRDGAGEPRQVPEVPVPVLAGAAVRVGRGEFAVALRAHPRARDGRALGARGRHVDRIRLQPRLRGVAGAPDRARHALLALAFRRAGGAAPPVSAGHLRLHRSAPADHAPGGAGHLHHAQALVEPGEPMGAHAFRVARAGRERGAGPSDARARLQPAHVAAGAAPRGAEPRQQGPRRRPAGNRR